MTFHRVNFAAVLRVPDDELSVARPRHDQQMFAIRGIGQGGYVGHLGGHDSRDMISVSGHNLYQFTALICRAGQDLPHFQRRVFGACHDVAAVRSRSQTQDLLGVIDSHDFFILVARFQRPESYAVKYRFRLISMIEL